jgi:hypothetical protein
MAAAVIAGTVLSVVTHRLRRRQALRHRRGFGAAAEEPMATSPSLPAGQYAQTTITTPLKGAKGATK